METNRDDGNDGAESGALVSDVVNISVNQETEDFALRIAVDTRALSRENDLQKGLPQAVVGKARPTQTDMGVFLIS